MGAAATQRHLRGLILDPEIFLSTKYNTPKRMTHFWYYGRTSKGHSAHFPRPSTTGRSAEACNLSESVSRHKASIIHQKASSVKRRHPSEGIIRNEASSMKRRHLLKDVTRQNLHVAGVVRQVRRSCSICPPHQFRLPLRPLDLRPPPPRRMPVLHAAPPSPLAPSPPTPQPGHSAR